MNLHLLSDKLALLLVCLRVVNNEFLLEPVCLSKCVYIYKIFLIEPVLLNDKNYFQYLFIF